MLRYMLVMMLVLAGAAGCASRPVVADNTPQNPTAVIERHVVNNGIKGFVPTESDETEFVRHDRMRNDMAFKGTGTFSGFFVGSHNTSTITRLDRKLEWRLDTEKERYTECPLAGCRQPVRREPGEAAAGKQQQQPTAQRQQGCTMSIAKNQLKVTPTGKRQTINGFDTRQYQLAWVVTMRDKRARTTTSTLSVDLWTTPETQAMLEAKRMEDGYARAHAAAARMALRDGATDEILPAQASQLMSSYLGGALSARDRKAFFAAGRELQKIKGYPILTKLTWDMNGNACAPDEKKQSSKSGSAHVPTSAGGLASLFVEKKVEEAEQESAGEPLLSFTVEVKKFQVEPQHDSLFEVPAGYQRVQPE